MEFLQFSLLESSLKISYSENGNLAEFWPILESELVEHARC
jgi:hypothetical protein